MTGVGDAPPMRADIARQPAVLTELLGRATSFVNAGRQVLTPGPGGRMMVSGCGDGSFAALAASAFAADLGLDWRPIGALELLLQARRLKPADRVLTISMSGNVDRTVEAARAVQAAGIPLLALVNGAGGRLAKVATAKLSLDLPDIAPFLCGTASYTATVAALMALAAGAAGKPAAVERLSQVAACQRMALAGADRDIPAVADGGATGVRFLSAGAELGTAQYGAAKFVELTRMPVWSADLEEFAHSQYWTMPSTDLIVVIAADPALAALATESCRALRGLGVRSLAIDTDQAPVNTADHRITLPAIDADTAPLATALPLQLLAYAVAEAGGLDPNKRLHLKNDEVRFRVSRQLTRRSLIGTGQ